jgi:acyl dehydratase
VYARQSLRFVAPLGVGEAVRAVVRVERVRRRRGGGDDAGGGGDTSAVVTFSTTASRAGGDGVVVVEGEAVAVVPL